MASDAVVPRLLMALPDYFGVDYVINPWMEGNVGRVDLPLARTQWEGLRRELSQVATIVTIAPAPGLPDMVFTANAGIVVDGIVIPSRFHYRERSPEETRFAIFFEANGFRLSPLPCDGSFEGAGDALIDHTRPLLFAGYGFRTSLECHPYLAEQLGLTVVSLRLVDPRFYHLDTCLAPLPNGALLYYPGALDHRSNEMIRHMIPAEDRIALDEGDALRFSANVAPVGNRLFMSECSSKLRARLSERGYTVVETPLSEFIKAGGGARCLTLPLDQTIPPAGKSATTVTQRAIDATGHLLDTGALSRMIDSVKESGGSLTVDSITPGDRKTDPSVARLMVTAPDAAMLDAMISRLFPLGGALPVGEEEDAHLLPAPADGVVPSTFYATSIYPTRVRLDGQWIPVRRQRMDGVIRIEDDGLPSVSLMRDVRKGDRVVLTGSGVRVETPQTNHGGGSDAFSFMRAEVSSERRAAGAVEVVAWEMLRARDRGGKIVVVAGPVVAHTGGVPSLCRLVREGFVSAFLGGNAIAVHDVEMALYGTSLGLDMKTGKGTLHGHRHHLAAINAIRGVGSLGEAVTSGLLTSGLMCELIRNDIPFSLAGSIRDDGPLPETKMDLVAAQADYARLLEGAEVVLALATMLHAIGVGNMIPASVKMFAIDINPAVVTKLADRGSLASVGIVTDTGLFLDLLANRLCEERTP